MNLYKIDVQKLRATASNAEFRKKLKDMLSENELLESNVFAFARWLNEFGWKVDSEDGYWFRECKDELTPDISVKYTDLMVWELFIKHCS